MTRYRALCAEVSSLIDAMDRPPVVGISGHGAAGKSTLAARLMADLGGAPEQVISTDHFYAAGPDRGPTCSTS